MTAIPWNVLSDSHSSQQLCSGGYWPENDTLPSLRPPSSAWKITLGHIFYTLISGNIISIISLVPTALSLPREAVVPPGTDCSYHRDPPTSAEHLAFHDWLVYVCSIVSHTFYHCLNMFAVHNLLIWKWMQIMNGWSILVSSIFPQTVFPNFFHLKDHLEVLILWIDHQVSLNKNSNSLGPSQAFMFLISNTQVYSTL